MKEGEPNFNREYVSIDKCRSCSSPAVGDILHLGEQHIVGFNAEGKDTPKVPLTLALCGDCNLLQLRDTTEPSLLWGDKYWYRSGVNQTMRNELWGIAKQVEQIAGLKEEDIVVDIGANDGTLLTGYENRRITRVGFDPSRNLIPYFYKNLRPYGVRNFCLFTDYFKKEPFLHRYGEHAASVVTAIAMFYDLDKPNNFIEDVKAILKRDGIFVIQQNYLVGMLKQNAFDNICHEHLEYYSLTSLEPLLARHGMKVFDVVENNINGGSFRTFVCNSGERPISERVSQMMVAEKEMGLDTPVPYLEFAERVKNNGWKLKAFLEGAKKAGKTVYVYGASTRGNTLLQFCGIDSNLIVAAAERNPDKWGLKTAGTNIPIVSEEEARKAQPDYFLVLPWHFKDEFIKREADFLDKGGKFIFPLPAFEVVHR